MTEQGLHITFHAGCGVWDVQPFDDKIEWHNDEYRGTYSECKKEAIDQMNRAQMPHYPNAVYGSIHDY